MTIEEDIQNVIEELNNSLIYKIISEDTFPYLEFYSEIPKVKVSKSNTEEDVTIYSVSLELTNSPDENNNFIVMMKVGMLVDPITDKIIEKDNESHIYYPTAALIEADLKTCHLGTLYQLLVNSTREDVAELAKKLLEKIYIDVYKK